MGFSDFLFGSKGTPSTVQTVTSPTFGFNEQARTQASNFLTDQLASVGRGELPQFFENQRPLLRRGLDRNLRQSFFGQEGRRGEGAVGQALGIGAQTGLGARSAVAGTNRQLQNFTNQSQAIDEFIAKQGIGIANQVAQNFPGQINAAPQGPPSQSFVVPGQAGTSGFLSDALGAGAGALLGAATGNPFAALSGISGLIPGFGGGGGGGGLPVGNILGQAAGIGQSLGQPKSQYRLGGSGAADAATNPFEFF